MDERERVGREREGACVRERGSEREGKIDLVCDTECGRETFIL